MMLLTNWHLMSITPLLIIFTMGMMKYRKQWFLMIMNFFKGKLNQMH